ncbi:hypothetical protein [Streptomyces sp. VRA16 Mangrove soil]|nr:hypothetical protein [Streptomyces sp. VRA16 Mangrove soil]
MTTDRIPLDGLASNQLDDLYGRPPVARCVGCGRTWTTGGLAAA